jgi:hypothetical protein
MQDAPSDPRSQNIKDFPSAASKRDGWETLDRVDVVESQEPDLSIISSGELALNDQAIPFSLEQVKHNDAQMVTIILRSTGDRRRDALRMRRVHGLLSSYPGNDRFAFHVFETSRRYHLEFPSSSTGYCPELHAQLLGMLGEGAIQIEPLRIQ